MVAAQRDTMHVIEMWVSELLLGRKVLLYSPLAPDELQQRVNAATGSIFSPFNFDKIVGWAGLGFIRLGYQSSPIAYNGKPILSGRLRSDRTGTQIRARFGASALTKLFFAIWYLVLGLIVSTLLIEPAAIEPGKGTAVVVMFGAFAFFPIAMHAVFTRSSGAEFERIIRFLEVQVQARPA